MTNDKEKLKEQNAANYSKARERIFTVRLSQEESDTLNDQVHKTGLTKGALIRATLANIQVREQNNKLTNDMLEQIAKIGNNFNQLVHAYHSARLAGVSVNGLNERLESFEKELVELKERL